MSKTFRQYDSRWGRLSYPPNTRSTMASAGCGPTACASIIVNNPNIKTSLRGQRESSCLMVDMFPVVSVPCGQA